jgi:2-polyprenyl-3-methyl-5-hydroxy-6-metoxy-1,4-benzoquinol methylase
MDRSEWLRDRRSAVERQYTLEGPTYDAGYDPATPVHRRFVSALLQTVGPGGALLDAACGTAPYAGMVLEAGVDYVGIDQSSGMLAEARAKWPTGRFEQIGLQEQAFADEFDAVMCVDAMENVPPEDWPLVVGAFRRALRADGHAYMTIERIDASDIANAFETGTAHGQPMVYGEVIDGDTAGYHFYPDADRVQGWLDGAGFTVVDDVDEQLDGYGYRHLLLQS